MFYSFPKSLKFAVFLFQATEAACWLALTYAPRALLAGDHFQLPPTILSPVAERQGLAVTLMERILRRADGHSCMCMLTTQYRMHEDIMKWVSDLLYQSKLTAHPSVAQHLLCHLPGVEDNEDTSKFQLFFLFIYLIVQTKLSILILRKHVLLMCDYCSSGLYWSAVKLRQTARLKLALLLPMNSYGLVCHSRCCKGPCKQRVP